MPVRDLRVPAARITSVDGTAGIDEILRVAADSDRTRLLVRAHDLARPVPELGEDTTVSYAIDVLLSRFLQPQTA
ncbi:hypothetical protein ACFY1L_03600 [Streptomyces sp. NPDC001663]|uniref:hypothetical protein n=1 Tax=Streptomyces sp. NPDC001663 TaxID=3364597 RepID=UPI0036A80C22